MEMWEYKVVPVGYQGIDESSLNGLGQQGWELAAAITGLTGAGAFILIFKRRKQSQDAHSSQRPF
jgi:Domain of unknown function (DUF4177)